MWTSDNFGILEIRHEENSVGSGNGLISPCKYLWEFPTLNWFWNLTIPLHSKNSIKLKAEKWEFPLKEIDPLRVISVWFLFSFFIRLQQKKSLYKNDAKNLQSSIIIQYLSLDETKIIIVYHYTYLNLFYIQSVLFTSEAFFSPREFFFHRFFNVIWWTFQRLFFHDNSEI